ncbi:hypothetical protein [Aestuariimicrobium sp. Y1814]|uniref:hypothetical protein n=1 Tax=Aestuariimicrobium sp. Y1814 TaxID=3418742 RepID=UPI003DA75F37
MAEPSRPIPIGSIIGAVGGLVFVLVNAAEVPGTLVWRILAALGFLAVIAVAVIRRTAPGAGPPSRTAMRTYGICVAAMALAIPVGASLLTNALSLPQLVLPWVVFVVGAHFLPFASAFRLPVFRWLALCLMLVGVAGAIGALVTGSAASAGWTGVTAGFVLLLFSALGPWMQPSPDTERHNIG